MRSSHRIRLTVIAASVVGAMLAVVFVALWWSSRTLELKESRSILRPALAQLVIDLDEGHTYPDLREQTDPNPALAIADYDLKSNLLAFAGAAKLKPVRGESNQSVDGPSGPIDYMTLSAESRGQLLVAGLEWTGRRRGLTRLATILAVLWPILVALVACTTWISATATFRPLQSLTSQASMFGATPGGRRLQANDDAEFGAFAAHLNGFLDRLEETVKREEQFAADAAHELRTPLTILSGHIETTLMRERQPGEYVTTLEVALAEVERLSKLVESLLQSALAGSGPVPAIDLCPSVEAVQARWVDTFENAKVHLELTCEPAVAEISEEEIGVVLGNVLDNSLRHSPVGSTCKLAMNPAADGIRITVSNQGPPIEPDMIDSIFERLVRSDSSRTRHQGGFGIGLATSKRILEARGGSISAENLSEGGVRFTVKLPQPKATV